MGLFRSLVNIILPSGKESLPSVILPINCFSDYFALIFVLPNLIQVFLNFYRRSVIGLNFDFLVLNITGFLCYSVFNLVLYISTVVQDQYFARFPGGVIPVQLNDLVFALHALALSSFTGFQALIFKVHIQFIATEIS